MSINPQFTYDGAGNPVGVFLTIQEWEEIERTMPVAHVPEWEKNLIRRGLEEYRQNKDNLTEWETIKAEMEAKDGPL
jgi:hypothetical protein